MLKNSEKEFKGKNCLDDFFIFLHFILFKNIISIIKNYFILGFVDFFFCSITEYVR